MENYFFANVHRTHDFFAWSFLNSLKSGNVQIKKVEAWKEGKKQKWEATLEILNGLQMLHLLQVVSKINSQSLEDTQVGYISQKYTLDKYTLEEYTLEQYTLENF